MGRGSARQGDITSASASFPVTVSPGRQVNRYGLGGTLDCYGFLKLCVWECVGKNLCRRERECEGGREGNDQPLPSPRVTRSVFRQHGTLAQQSCRRERRQRWHRSCLHPSAASGRPHCCWAGATPGAHRAAARHVAARATAAPACAALRHAAGVAGAAGHRLDTSPAGRPACAGQQCGHHCRGGAKRCRQYRSHATHH